MNSVFTAADFWQFSLDLYRQPQVKESCLTLQDKYGLNVNLLLLCCYLQQRGVAIQDFTLLHRALEPTDSVLKPLRSTRRASKDLNPIAYQQLLDAELTLEKQQQSALVEVLSGMIAEGDGDNAAGYCRFANVPLCDDIQRWLQPFKSQGQSLI